MSDKDYFTKTGFGHWDYKDLHGEQGGQALNALDIITRSPNFLEILNLLSDQERTDYLLIVNLVSDLEQEINNRTIAQVLEHQGIKND